MMRNILKSMRIEREKQENSSTEIRRERKNKMETTETPIERQRENLIFFFLLQQLEIFDSNLRDILSLKIFEINLY